MKTKTSVAIRNYFLFIAMMIFFAPVSISQQADAAAMDMERYAEFLKALEPDPPVYFTTRTRLEPAETHVLDTLSIQERNLIESFVDPPAIGVIRDLSPPIYFNPAQIDIPVEGEVSVSGGRLARINEDTLVFTTRIGSRKADEIRVFFSEGYFPPGVQVNLFSDYDHAFTQVQLRGRISEYGFFTTTTFADHVIIQVIIPQESLKEEPYFEISKVWHVDNRYLPEDDRSCFLDANCSTANSFSGIDLLRSSTVRLAFPLWPEAIGLCTGNLINDNRNKDIQPFLLTAYHCFASQSQAEALEARFKYWSTSCNSGALNPNQIVLNGANLISTGHQTDFTLVLLKQFAPGSLLGWTTSQVDNDVVFHSTNHPGGGLMRYVRGINKTSGLSECSEYAVNLHMTRPTHGRTAKGSSGAAAVDDQLRIRGQLFGICVLIKPHDPCDYNEYFNAWGKFGESYNNNNLGFWLNNGGASVTMSTIPASFHNFDFVNIGSSKDLTVTVTNSGTRPQFMNLEAGNAYIVGSNANQFSIIGSNTLYLPPGESGTITVRFSPTSLGVKNATLAIPNNADNVNAIKEITLTGTGTADPCVESISLGNGGIVNAKVFSKSGSGFWNITACGKNTPGREQVYFFVAPATGTYRIQVTATNNAPISYFWKTGSCSPTGWNCIVSTSVPGVYGNLEFTKGQLVYFLLDSETTSLATHGFYIFFDPCQSITNINGTGPSHTQSYSSGGNGVWFATTPTPCGSTSQGVEKIFSFTPSVTGIYSLNVTSTTGAAFYMWKSGSCNAQNWQCMSKVTSPGIYGHMSMTAGTTYLVLVVATKPLLQLHEFFVREPSNPGTWTGIVSTAWNTAGNWSDGVVPTANTNVFIPPGTPFSPVVTGPAICNTVTVQSGATLSIRGNGLTVHAFMTVNGTLNMPNNSSVLTVGQNETHSIEFNSGSNAILNNGRINCYGWVIPRQGSSFNPSNNFTIFFWGNTEGGPSNHSPTATYSNIIIAKNENQIAYFDSLATQPLVVTGDFTLVPNSRFKLLSQNMIVQGTINDHATSEIIIGTSAISDQGVSSFGEIKSSDMGKSRGGLLEIISDFNLKGLLDIGGGEVLVQGEFSSNPFSSLLISGGSLISNAPNLGNKDWQFFYGDLSMTGGIFQLTNNSLYLAPTATTSVSGGTIRTGGGFFATSPGVFQPTGGAVEIIGDNLDNVIQCHGGNFFHDLIMNRDNGFSVIQGNHTLVQNKLVIENGELSVGSLNISVSNNVEINSEGKLSVTGTAKLLMGNSGTVTVNDGGMLELSGSSPANPATISHISDGYYGLIIGSGGTLAAENTIFEYMDIRGVLVLPGAVIDPDRAFTHCTFRNGEPGGNMLRIENNQTFEVFNAHFTANTWDGAYNVFKNLDGGNVTFTDYTGDFSGSAFEFDPDNRIHWTNELPLGFSLQIKVILEGAYTSGGPFLMHTILRDNALVPLNQPYGPALPYFGNNNPVWYYTGSESVASIPATVVDWVLVELRDAPSPAQALPGTSIARRAAFLHRDGFIRDISGGMISFDLTIQNNLYVVVYHRNHLAVMSSGGLPLIGGVYSWNFTQTLDKAFNNTSGRSGYLQGQKNLGGGVFGMFGGDGDGNGQIQTQDKNEVWNAESGLSGYRAGDFDMNSQVQTQDKNNIWNANSGVASQVP